MGRTPAQAAGLTGHQWTIEELLSAQIQSKEFFGSLLLSFFSIGFAGRLKHFGFCHHLLHLNAIVLYFQNKAFKLAYSLCPFVYDEYNVVFALCFVYGV
jgi:hypothetical protein